MSDQFETLIRQCEQSGEPFQCLARKSDGTYQISLRSKHSKGAHEAFACDTGKSPVEALKNIMRQRRITVSHLSAQEVDPLS